MTVLVAVSGKWISTAETNSWRYSPGRAEEAPRFYVLLTAPWCAGFASQQSVVRHLNVSSSTWAWCLVCFEELLIKKISLSSALWLGFITYLIVLLASVLISKYQRMGRVCSLNNLRASHARFITPSWNIFSWVFGRPHRYILIAVV
jgi:hypothetical protein